MIFFVSSGRKTTIQPVNNQSSGSRDALSTCFDLCTQHDAVTARRAGPSVCGRRDARTNNFRSTQVLYLLNFTRRMFENVIYVVYVNVKWCRYRTYRSDKPLRTLVPVRTRQSQCSCPWVTAPADSSNTRTGMSALPGGR